MLVGRSPSSTKYSSRSGFHCVVLYFEWAQIVAETATFTMSCVRVFYAIFHRGANYTMPSEGAVTKLNKATHLESSTYWRHMR